MSAVLILERGSPSFSGNSQARAFTSTTTSGGKSPGPPRSRTVLQPLEALPEEALSPLAHHLPPRVEASSDLVVGKSLAGEKDHLGTLYFKIR
jgi:hypothetical protein